MSKPTAEQLNRRKIAQEQGFHDCEKVELIIDSSKMIQGFGKIKRSNIKALHQSNIDALNEQQLNSKQLIRKKETTYCLIKRYAKGREYPSGHNLEGQPMPYYFYVEKDKLSPEQSEMIVPNSDWPEQVKKTTKTKTEE